MIANALGLSPLGSSLQRGGGFREPRFEDGWDHIPWSPSNESEARKHQVIVLKRDPRDIVVSWAHYLNRYPDPYLDWGFSDKPINVRLQQIACEYRFLDRYTRWQMSGFLVLKYESFFNDRVEAFERLSEFGDPEKMVERSLEKVRPHYWQAQPGIWRTELPEHPDGLRDLARRWGYD